MKSQKELDIETKLEHVLVNELVPALSRVLAKVQHLDKVCGKETAPAMAMELTRELGRELAPVAIDLLSDRHGNSR